MAPPATGGGNFLLAVWGVKRSNQCNAQEGKHEPAHPGFQRRLLIGVDHAGEQLSANPLCVLSVKAVRTSGNCIGQFAAQFRYSTGRNTGKTMLNRKILLAAACIWITVPDAHAYGFCSAPSAPGNYSKPAEPSPPTTPYCVNKFSNTHTCSDWEISNYNRAVDQYNDELIRYQRERQAYINKLVDYANEAQEYSICEINSLDR